MTRVLRPWLALWCVLMLSACYVAGWSFWSYTHLNRRFVQLPPGESAHTGKGSPFRITQMSQTPVLNSRYDTQFRAETGMTFVVVRFEVTKAVPDDYCLFRLAGADGRDYETTSKVYGRALPNYCPELPTGVPTEGEVIFEVPVSAVDRIAGVYDSAQWDWRTRHLAATPPA